MRFARVGVVVAVVAVATAGCSRALPPTPGTAPSTDFCKAVIAFRDGTAGLAGGATANPQIVVQQVNGARTALAKAADLAPNPQVKANIAVVATVFDQMAKNLQTVRPGDGAGYVIAVDSARTNPKADQAAADQLDAFTRSYCGSDNTSVTTAPSASTTTPASPTTTAGVPVGPTVPASSTTLAPAGSPVPEGPTTVAPTTLPAAGPPTT